MGDKRFIAYIERYNKVQDLELSQLTAVELVGYYCKNFELCMVDKLLDDMKQNKVPYVLGSKVQTLLEALSYGGVGNDLGRE